MIPVGTPIQYSDFVGKVVRTPCGSKDDPEKVWLQTADLFLVAVPAQSKKLIVLDKAPEVKLSAEEKELAQLAGIPLPPEPKQEAKYFPKTGYVKVPESKKAPAGLYKVLAGGLGADRDDLKDVTARLNSRVKNKPFTVISSEDNSWHVVIEITR